MKDENPATFLLSPGWTVQCSETPLVTRFFCNALTASGFHSQAWTCRALACTRYGRVKYPIPDKVMWQHLIDCYVLHTPTEDCIISDLCNLLLFWCLSKNNNKKKHSMISPAYKSTTVSPLQSNWETRSFSVIFPAENMHLVTSNSYLKKTYYIINFRFYITSTLLILHIWRTLAVYSNK